MFKSRKFSIWLISLVVVLIIYLLYNRISRTPKIDIDTGTKSANTVVDSNVGRFGEEVGMIGDVGVEAVQEARYTHLNKDKKVDREFGFEKLLYEIGDEWEIEKPYMNVFRRNFKFYITADRGKVQVVSAAGRTSPKDATLTGNVVIRILPENTSSIKEGFVYLDDVVFISEKSQFSTDGPVKFVSENAQMLGTGLEIIYNDESDRLESLRIIHLETLRLKMSSKASLFSSSDTNVGGSADTDTDTDTASRTQPEPTAETVGQHYRAVFSKNVIIDSPEQLVFADEIFINNIQGEEGTKAQRHKGTKAQRRKDDEQRTTNNEEQFTDVIVTCDDGILVTPMDSPESHKNSTELDADTTLAENRKPRDFNDADGRAVFSAQRIDYCVSTGNTVASGSSELIFDVNNFTADQTEETPVPVKIIAHEKVRFLPASNQVIFEGNCLCKTFRDDANIRQKYTLSAPKLTVNLSANENKQTTDLEHFTADGGIVRLSSIKTAQEKSLGGIELKCLRFDYDPARQFFLATGPHGTIVIDNSEISEPKRKVAKFSLRKRCYAVVRDFETLKYFPETNRVIADAGNQAILIDYFPVVDGRYGQQVKATASHIEADLIETDTGQNELSMLSATGGITYKEEGKKKKWGKSKSIQFVGSELLYDADKSMITAWGDEFQPAYFNGAFVDVIEYNLKTGRVKTRIVGPGAL